PREVLEYFISPDNLRPKLLPALLENPSVPEIELVKLARAAMRETIETMLKSPRIRSLSKALDALRSNPYLKKEEAAEIDKAAGAEKAAPQSGPQEDSASSDQPVPAASTSPVPGAEQPENVFGEPDEE